MDDAVSDTEIALARANMLLERYGIVSREAALAENIPGGFGPIYKVMSALEESGRVRRGYFVEGLSAAQFARPGIVDSLRLGRQEDEAVDIKASDISYLAVIDPANPWGNLLSWPETGGGPAAGQPRRVAGAWLLLHAGKPLLYLSASGRQLITFPPNLIASEVRAAAFAALSRFPEKGRRGSLIIEKIDGQSIRESRHYEAMLGCGFVSDYRGLVAEAFT